MVTKQQFERELAKHEGATLDQETIEFDFNVDTPKGFVWKENGCHCLVEAHNNGMQSFKSSAYAELIKRMSHGMEICTTLNCDVCN